MTTFKCPPFSRACKHPAERVCVSNLSHVVNRECEQYGMAVSNKLDFNTAEEAAEVEEVFNNAIQCLSEADRALGPVARMLPMLKKVKRELDGMMQRLRCNGPACRSQKLMAGREAYAAI